MKIDNPYVLFALAWIGAISFLIPTELRYACAWIFVILALKLIPWPAYKEAPHTRIYQNTRNAERATIAVLCGIWVLGIVGSAIIENYSPSLLERKSAETIGALSKLQGNERPEYHEWLRDSQDMKNEIYVAQVVDQRIVLMSGKAVYAASVRDFINPVSQYSAICFLAAGAIFLILGYLMNALISALRE